MGELVIGSTKCAKCEGLLPIGFSFFNSKVGLTEELNEENKIEGMNNISKMIQKGQMYCSKGHLF